MIGRIKLLSYFPYAWLLFKKFINPLVSHYPGTYRLLTFFKYRPDVVLILLSAKKIEELYGS